MRATWSASRPDAGIFPSPWAARMNHDRNPSILVHGSWKQSAVPQYIKDWTSPKGWPWKARFEHRAMLVPGDVLILWGKVTSKTEKNQMGLIDLEIGMVTHDGVESMPGSATVVLPLRNGPDIPGTDNDGHCCSH